MLQQQLVLLYSLYSNSSSSLILSLLAQLQQLLLLYLITIIACYKKKDFAFKILDTSTQTIMQSFTNLQIGKYTTTVTDHQVMLACLYIVEQQRVAEYLDLGVVTGLIGLASASLLPAPTLPDQKSDSTVSDKLESSLRIIGLSTVC